MLFRILFTVEFFIFKFYTLKVDKKYLQSYKYIGLGFQLVAVVGIFVLLGLELDKMLLNQIPFLTIIMSIIGVAASLYYVIKDVSKKK